MPLDARLHPGQLLDPACESITGLLSTRRVHVPSSVTTSCIRVSISRNSSVVNHFSCKNRSKSESSNPRPSDVNASTMPSQNFELMVGMSATKSSPAKLKSDLLQKSSGGC